MAQEGRLFSLRGLVNGEDPGNTAEDAIGGYFPEAEFIPSYHALSRTASQAHVTACTKWTAHCSAHQQVGTLLCTSLMQRCFDRHMPLGNAVKRV
eukprot:1157574-Pelagomonas_calceolata.AAC.11